MKHKKVKKKVSPETVERWWAGLPPSDKVFMYEIGGIMASFKSGMAANIMYGQAGVERSVGQMMREITTVYDRESVSWPKNPARKRGLN